MQRKTPPWPIWATVTLSSVQALVVLGCNGSTLPKTHPIRGKLALTTGKLQHLAGSYIEAALEADPLVRASGEIQEDGSFTLTSQHAGNLLTGAPAGNYRVRIILTNEDPRSRQQAKESLAARFLQFKTSGLSFQVPAEDEVLLQVSAQ